MKIKMKIKMKMMNCILILMMVSMLMSSLIYAESVATSIDTAQTTNGQARTNITEWRYKVIGDHLYKRLYNLSTGEWETDWILVQ